MRIAVNTRLLLEGKLEGIGWFTYESLQRITTQHPEHEFLFLFDRPYSKQFVFAPNVTPVVTGPPSRHPFLWYWWFEFSVPAALRKHKADIFLSPDGYLSLRSAVPSIAVIHDINFEHYPKDLPFLFRKYYRHFFPRYAQKADRIATVSTFSKHDIAEHYGVNPEKIDVVYNGANERYRPIDANSIASTRAEMTDGAPYFLFIGALHPRKNIARMLLAYDQFRKQSDSKVKLLIVGGKKWWTGDMKTAFEGMQFQQDVIFAGRIAPEKLHHVIAAAMALVYVSYFEGFGIPILEALKCDVPVITSDATSMPEVAGKAALLVDPFSTESIATAMQQMAEKPELRAELIAAGRKQSQQFSWQQTADRLWQTIEQVMGTH